MTAELDLPRDFVDLLTEFGAADVQYLVIGGYAVGFHDRPRATKDLDVLLGHTPENVERACRALASFGAPNEVVAALHDARLDEIVWFGSPPERIDLLKSAPGVSFAEAHGRRARLITPAFEVSIVGIEDLIQMKLAAGRDQDLVDVKRLRRAAERAKRGG